MQCFWWNNSVALVTALGIASAAAAQPADEKPAEGDAPKPVEIADEPKAIDPATILPEKLAAKVTVEFDDKNLKDIVAWLQDEQGLSVLVDQQDIVSSGASLVDPITDSLNDEPLYLLLDRLSQYGFGWYLEDNVLHLTSAKNAEQRMTTQPYNIGELIDAGYDANDVIHAIIAGTSGPWEPEDEGSAIILLGDVAFVRQPPHVQREVAGLLAALRTPARRTFTLDAPQHAVIRAKLQEAVSLDADDEPLLQAVKDLAEQAEIDIRLDGQALRQSNLRDRTPVTLTMSDQKLGIVLQALVAEWGFKPVPKDGVLWLTTKAIADRIHTTAVYDVRDLCRDQNESAALANALLAQTKVEWADDDGEDGPLRFARPGVLVVNQTEAGHDEVLQLLENYRTALRASKPRPRKVDDPKEVIAQYYRMPTNMASDLQLNLPQLIKPETWKENDQAAAGSILMVASRAELMSEGESNQVVDYSVLIIRQAREIHQEIAELFIKVEHGDAQYYNRGGMGGGMGGMGMGGGGFGGGYFSLPPEVR